MTAGLVASFSPASACWQASSAATAGRVVAKTIEYQWGALRHVVAGRVVSHRLPTACMDPCREVNKVPEGVSRLTIIRKEPQGEFPDVKYRSSSVRSCQHCDHAACAFDVSPDRCVSRCCQWDSSMLNPDLYVGSSGTCIAAVRSRALYPSGHEDGGQCDFSRKTNLQAGKFACVEACPTKALTFGNPGRSQQ